MNFLQAVLPIALLWALTGPSHAQRLPFASGDGNFSGEALMRGSQATQAQCAAITDAVWAKGEPGEAECIRYWAAGLRDAGNPRALVYLPADQIAADRPEATYESRNPKLIQELANGMQVRAGLPFILLSRPGMLGSSGDHKLRRRAGEAKLVSAALDEIKARHGIREFGLAGLSGGGHTVAALLGWRSDIVCAVAASAVSSPKRRWQSLGLAADVTGATDSYEPVEHLKPGTFHPHLRVFVLGDPKDTEVPWISQTPLAQRLRELGVATEIMTGEGTGTKRHVLGSSAQAVGSMCLSGQSTADILEAAKRGLKG
jgi:hypothetical protein